MSCVWCLNMSHKANLSAKAHHTSRGVDIKDIWIMVESNIERCRRLIQSSRQLGNSRCPCKKVQNFIWGLCWLLEL